MKTLNLININSKILFFILIGMIVMLSVSYMFFVSSTVRNVVVRKSLIEQVASLNSTLATLESEYVSSSSLVDMDLAVSLGFREVRNPTFISKKQAVSLSSSLSR